MTTAEDIKRAREDGEERAELAAWRVSIEKRQDAVEQTLRTGKTWLLWIVTFLFGTMSVSTPAGHALLVKVAGAVLGADQ